MDNISIIKRTTPHKWVPVLPEADPALFKKLKDPALLRQFMNSAIPGLHYTTVINPEGVNVDHRSLLHREDGIPSLNIYETGEVFDYKINKYYITWLDLLRAVMSVKSAKEDFYYEKVRGVLEFDPEEQLIVLEVDHGS